MSDVIQKAVTENDQESFDTVRKLTACGIMLSEDNINAEDAAAQADKSIFQKTKEYVAGKCEEDADKAVDEIIDRQAATLTVLLNQNLERYIHIGCRAIGGGIGLLFGGAGVIIGQQIGEMVAIVLNKEMSEILAEGIKKVNEFAKTAYQEVKTSIKEIGTHVKNILFG